MREMGCIYSIASLLLKLFPGGASVDYIEDEFMGKLLGQLLTLVSISVKNNKENKIYTFQSTMRTIQKYVQCLRVCRSDSTSPKLRKIRLCCQ